MSRELTRAEELVQKIQEDSELIKRIPEMTKDEALDLARKLGYGDVTEEDLMEVFNSDRELSGEAMGDVAGGGEMGSLGAKSVMKAFCVD